MALYSFKDKKNRKLIKLLTLLTVILILSLGALGVKELCTIDDVSVVGNEHYTDEEIIDFIAAKPYEKNSIYLFLKYNNKTIKDIPFVEQMDVKILSPSSIKVTVYEKAIAGYVEYLGHYMYFDKDGIVVEGSQETTPGVPFVTGLSFDHMVLYEKLPVEDDSVFLMILSITQLLNKYGIATDRIYFDLNRNITLYFGDARVYLGTSDYIDEKINEMHLLLPKLEGFSGVLHMENYTGETGVFTFTKDEEPGVNSGENAIEEDENEEAASQEAQNE